MKPNTQPKPLVSLQLPERPHAGLEGWLARPNPHEAAARAERVRKIVEVIDAAFGLFTPPVRRAEIVAQLSDEQFGQAAQIAGIKPPSPATCAEVVRVFRERAGLSARLRGAA